MVWWPAAKQYRTVVPYLRWDSKLDARVEDIDGNAKTTFKPWEQIWFRGTLTRADGALLPVEYCGDILAGIEDRWLADGPVDEAGSFETHFLASDLAEGVYAFTVLYPGYPRPQLGQRSLGDIKGGITYFTANPLTAAKGELIYCDFEVKNWDTWWAHKYRVSLAAVSPAFIEPVQLYSRDISLGKTQTFGYHASTGLYMPAGDVTITLTLERQELLGNWILQGTKSVTISYIATPPAGVEVYVLPSSRPFTITISSQVEEKPFPWWLVGVAGAGVLAAYVATRKKRPAYGYPIMAYG